MYNTWLKRVPLRRMLAWTMVLGVLLGSTQLLLVSGLSRQWGISDEFFVLGDSVVITVLGQVGGWVDAWVEGMGVGWPHTLDLACITHLGSTGPARELLVLRYIVLRPQSTCTFIFLQKHVVLSAVGSRQGAVSCFPLHGLRKICKHVHV